MTMNQAEAESNSVPQDPVADQLINKIEVAANSQLDLCVAANLIIDRSEHFAELEREPELMALRGVIGAIEERAKALLQEVAIADFDAAMRIAAGGAA